MQPIRFRPAMIVAVIALVAATPLALAQVKVTPGLGGGYKPPTTLGPAPGTSATTLSPTPTAPNLNTGATVGGAPRVDESDSREIERAQVAPPPPAEAQPAPDGGGDDCACSDGRVADVEGWCWRQSAESGAWAREETCRN